MAFDLTRLEEEFYLCDVVGTGSDGDAKRPYLIADLVKQGKIYSWSCVFAKDNSCYFLRVKTYKEYHNEIKSNKSKKINHISKNRLDSSKQKEVKDYLKKFRKKSLIDSLDLKENHLEKIAKLTNEDFKRF